MFKDLKKVFDEWSELSRLYIDSMKDGSAFKSRSILPSRPRVERPTHPLWYERDTIMPFLDRGVKMRLDRDVIVIDPKGCGVVEIAVLVGKLRPEQCESITIKGRKCIRLWWDIP